MTLDLVKYMLSIEQKNNFLGIILKLQRNLNALKTENTLQELERFENQLTLNELSECLHTTPLISCETKLKELLAQRWERVRGSSMCYTQKPTNRVNQLCLQLAMALSPPITTPSEIDALEPNTGPYCLLMPSLENCEDVYGENIHSLRLHEFVLSDNERVFIPLVSCLHQASISDAGQLRHMVEIDGQYPQLTPSEIERISKHSKQATELYQALLALNKQRLLGDDIGAQLSHLVVALRNGGSHGRGSGSPMNAGAEANLGILTFNDYWNDLSEQKKAFFLAEAPVLNDIIGRLFRPNDVNYRDRIYCVELLADELDTIIKICNEKSSIQILKKKVETQENALKLALKKPQNRVFVQNLNPPKHILPLIFKLSAVDQKQLFKKADYENALIYALANHPDALLEFALDERSKQQAIEARIKPNNESGLIVAAKSGESSALELLLSWGADIESRDVHGNTALHWAAKKDHAEIVTYLLEKGASLESQGHGGYTALHFAIYHGNAKVALALLNKNIGVTVRAHTGENPLEIAINKHPELVALLLMKIALLPADKQAEYLLEVPDGPYPNVLFFTKAYQPSLFDKVLTAVLEQPKISMQALITSTDKNGKTLLMLAAQIGASESVRKLLAAGINIEARDAYNFTALHLAASQGYCEVVSCLLAHGALANSGGGHNETPLHFAVRNGNRAVVELLLQKNANLNVRNSKGLNALDMAVEYHQELIEPLLMKIALLPTDEQAECLLTVPKGPYPNVLFFAKTYQPSLFDKVLTAVLEQPKISMQALITSTDKNGKTLLMLAAQIGASESVRKLLAAGVNIEARDAYNFTALHLAASQGYCEVVSCLLAHGALANSGGGHNETPLHFAVRNGNRAVVELLLQKNANLNVRNSKGLNALDMAVEYHQELIEPLLMKIALLSADKQAECLSARDELYPNVLFFAKAYEPPLFVKVLNAILEQPKTSVDVLVSSSNKYGWTPLILAAQLGAVESIHKLLAARVNIETHDADNCTALHWAAISGQQEAVSCLLDNGALLDALGGDNNTPLNFAVRTGNRAVVELLLQRNANLDARNSKGQNALDLAIKKHSELVPLLLMKIALLPADNQAECLLKVPKGPYPNVLFFAKTYQPSLFDKLLTAVLEQPKTSMQAFIRSTDKNGKTLLILAAQIGASESIRKLLAAGVDIKSHDADNCTALHWAAISGQQEVVSCLLDNGALLDARGYGNNTPLNFAVCYGRSAVVELLLQKQANLNARNSTGKNALDIAIEKQHPKLAKLILTQMFMLPIDEQAKGLLKIPEGPYPNVLFLAATLNDTLMKELLHSFKKGALDSKMQPIYEHLYQISLHYKKMIKKCARNPNYENAISAAKTLLNSCIDELLKIQHSNENMEVKLLRFKRRCADAIETARPVLTKYREWGKVLAAFLLAIITLPISLALYTAGFFSVKTQSEKLLDNFQLDVNKIG